MFDSSALLGTAIQTESVVSKIINRITDAIISGELKPGDKLPTEVNLCSSLGVGRNSVREAIKILEAYGVLYIKRPDGTFVSDHFSKKMLDPMLYGILLQQDSGSDLIHLRNILDVGILQTLISDISPIHLQYIHSAYTDLQAACTASFADAKQILDADIHFHMALANATENKLLINIYSYVDRITVPSRTRAISRMMEEAAFDNFLELHRKIVSIVVQRNLSAIDSVISEHYVIWKQIISHS